MFITTPALTVEDLGSTNGTWLRRTDPDGTVHETAVREPVTLRPGDTLRLGAVSLVLVPSFVGGPTTSPAGDGSPSLDPAMREVHALLARAAGPLAAEHAACDAVAVLGHDCFNASFVDEETCD